MVVRIARRYHQRKHNFCVITFYDPQRAAITKALENEDLPSDCVYNVDSFQGMWHSPCICIDSLRLSSLIRNHRWSGNEADYVILSSVRTKHAGFLKSQPRMNVALTRCKKGMVVVTDKSFLQGAGKSTLLGQLCRTWSRHHVSCWIDRKAMLNNSGALPGLSALGPAPARSNGIHSHNLRGRTTTTLPRNASSQTQTQTHQNQVTPSVLTWAALRPSFARSLVVEHDRRSSVSNSNSNYRRRGGGGGGGVQTAAAVVRRQTEDEFPSLQSLGVALDQSSRHRTRSRKGRK